MKIAGVKGTDHLRHKDTEQELLVVKNIFIDCSGAGGMGRKYGGLLDLKGIAVDFIFHKGI